MTMRIILALALALAAGPVRAQAGAPSVTEAVDPVRLAAAREVVDLAFPPATRATMFAGVQDAIMPMMTRMIEGHPDLKRAFDADPRVKPIFDRYIVKVQTRAKAAIQARLPVLFDAYGLAYARRFTLAQLGDLKTFFATPTSQLYTSRTLSLLKDPDVAAASQASMVSTMGDMRSDAKEMVAEIKALPPVKAQPQSRQVS